MKRRVLAIPLVVVLVLLMTLGAASAPGVVDKRGAEKENSAYGTGGRQFLSSF